MTRQNKKFKWFIFCTFVGIFVVLFSVLNIGYKQNRIRRNGNYWSYFYEELPPDSLDIVFMGNSHSQCTFIPEIIDDILGTNSINLITSGGSIYQTVFEYQEVLRYQYPKVVIIEPYVVYGGRTQENLMPWNISFFDSVPMSIRKIGYIHKFFSTNNLIDYLLPFKGSHSDWKTPNKFIDRMFGEIKRINAPVELIDKGYLQLKDPLLPGEIELKKPEEYQSCPTEDIGNRLILLENFLGDNLTHKNNLLFLAAPLYGFQFYQCQQLTSDLIEDNGFAYNDVFDNDGLPFMWFRNAGHMTQFGAIVASVETASILAEKLNLTVDLEAVHYYQSYYFEDYSLSQDGQKINIQLVPAEIESSNNLTYQWEVFREGESIFQSSKQVKPEFNFAFLEPGDDYEIHVEINNPDGDYVLEGVFMVTVEQ